MTDARPSSDPRLAVAVAVHALFWLVVGSVIGLGLASLLAFPRLGALLGPASYGRWMPLHLDLTLYGWLAMPMLGLLLGFFAVGARAGSFALWAWSAALVSGSVAWLAGRTSGKSFLEWTGGARWMLAGALAILWVTSLQATFAERGGPRRRTWARAAGLALTGGAAIGLLRATRADGYPPIDPTSGGPTGTSLLASTLALVVLLLAIPRLAGLPLRSDVGGLHGAGRVRRVGGWWIGLLVAHGALCLGLGFADRSNLEMAQIAGLASLLPWAGLVPWDWSRFEWPLATRGWRRAALAWGSVLALSGVAQFWPAWLGPAKFTHGLVAHAHLAMAGFTSSVAFLVLESKLVASAPSLSPLGASPMFALWQLGTVFHVLALAGVGVMEVRDPAVFLRGAAAVPVLLGARWLAGAAMLAGAWLAWRRAEEQR